MYKCKYFGIKELVSPVVYAKYRDFAWSFFEKAVLKDLDTIRREWGDSIIINDWAWGGHYKESGLRSNVDSLVKSKTQPYLSAHVLARGFDLKPKNRQYKKFHAFLWELLSSGKLKVMKRLENIKDAPTWGHVDAFQTERNKPVMF